MVKGCSKKFYYIKNTGGKYFEEAYLIMRADISEKRIGFDSRSLAAEAERIVADASVSCGGFDAEKYIKPKKHGISRGMSFALGAASSSAIIGITAFLLAIS